MARGKPVVLSKRSFAKKGDAHAHFQAMLRRYRPGDRVSQSDAADLESLLDRHPNRDEKIGSGVAYFEVQSADFGTQCFRAVRNDGTWARFSYKVCI